MTAQKRKDEINLLPEKGFQTTTTGRVLAWILSTFRIIVIVTEIIVMAAFLSRFWLDAQNSDLSEKIQQRQAVLVASQNFETQFKLTQLRLKILSDSTKQLNISDTLKTIVEALPADVFLTKIDINKEGILISGNTPNEKSIQQLSVNLNSRDDFDNFSIVAVDTNVVNQSLLDFSLKGKRI